MLNSASVTQTGEVKLERTHTRCLTRLTLDFTLHRGRSDDAEVTVKHAHLLVSNHGVCVMEQCDPALSALAATGNDSNHITSVEGCEGAASEF